MNEKQRRFAEEYIISGNAHQAALKAGYSKTYARTDSHKLLENPRIRPYIDEQLEKLRSEKVADQQEILEFLTSIVRGEIEEPILVGLGEGAQEIQYDIPSVTARRQAAVDLGKRYGMWTDRQDINLTVPQIVEDVPLND